MCLVTLVYIIMIQQQQQQQSLFSMKNNTRHVVKTIGRLPERKTPSCWPSMITNSIVGLLIIIHIEIVHEVHKKKGKTHKSIKSVYTQMLNQSKHIVMCKVIRRHAQ